jgi:hypothetical protein
LLSRTSTTDHRPLMVRTKEGKSAATAVLEGCAPEASAATPTPDMQLANKVSRATATEFVCPNQRFEFIEALLCLIVGR